MVMRNGKEEIMNAIRISNQKVGIQFRKSLSQNLDKASNFQTSSQSSILKETEYDHPDTFLINNNVSFKVYL